MRTVQQPFAFIGSQTLSLINRDAAATCPTFCRFTRFAFSVKRLGNGRTAFFNFAIGLRFRQIRDFQRQTTRRGEPLNVAVRDASVIQLRGKVCSKGLSQAAQCFGGSSSVPISTRKVFSDMAASYLSLLHIGKPRASREA